jgi:hypothetical protein
VNDPIYISPDMLKAFPDDVVRTIVAVKLASCDENHPMYAAFWRTVLISMGSDFTNLPEKGGKKKTAAVVSATTGEPTDKPKRKRGPNKPKPADAIVVGAAGEVPDDEARTRLLGYLGSQQKLLSAKELQEGCNLTDGQVKGLVKRLLEQGAITKDGVARGTKYRLAVFDKQIDLSVHAPEKTEASEALPHRLQD